MNWFSIVNLSEAFIYKSFNLMCTCFFFFLLILLSGDVEINPGPTINDQVDIALLLQWLDPLVNWQSFALQLPGITENFIASIDKPQFDLKQKKEACFTKWLTINPEATWNDVIHALTVQREDETVQAIRNQLEVPLSSGIVLICINMYKCNHF